MLGRQGKASTFRSWWRCGSPACDSSLLVAKRVLAQRYFTINWIQLAVTWAAFALFILALSFL